MIYNPLEAYESELKATHAEKTAEFLRKLVAQSGVDVAQNRETVRQYNIYRENFRKLRKKYNWMRFWRVLMCISVVLIPLVILKMTPKIRALRVELEAADQRADELFAEAQLQMAPLNALFTDRDALHIIEDTIPDLSFAEGFPAKQEEDMRINYNFPEDRGEEQSTLAVLAGHYNENPFLFENKLVHTMGLETYHGYRTIYWTETYEDSDGKVRTRTESETLHATVTKPKPYYSTQVILHYCAQAGPELSFSRDATHLEDKSEKEIERYVKRGEKRLKKKTDEAIRENDDFVSMSNSDFEVLFDALDRTDEVQFRTLFTPLAQTNMVDLIRSKAGYGDDFNFFKTNRTNKIITEHSQGRGINLLPHNFHSHSYDIIESNFLQKNGEYFKAVYFDFAPLWAIPAYQERPVHSLKPIPDLSQKYSLRTCEALANVLDSKYVVHPDTKTQAILKSSYVGSVGNADETCITAYSYDIAPQVDLVAVYGGDGRYHDVPVEWSEYLPLEMENHFFVSSAETAGEHTVIASRNGLCIFN